MSGLPAMHTLPCYRVTNKKVMLFQRRQKKTGVGHMIYRVPNLLNILCEVEL